nr:MAG TPA: hypothetical protein [Caudoviricetes sp.]
MSDSYSIFVRVLYFRFLKTFLAFAVLSIIGE